MGNRTGGNTWHNALWGAAEWLLTEEKLNKPKIFPSSLGNNVLLLWGFHNPQAAVCKLHKEWLLHVFFHERAFVFCLVNGQQQLPEVWVQQQASQFFRFSQQPELLQRDAVLLVLLRQDVSHRPRAVRG